MNILFPFINNTQNMPKTITVHFKDQTKPIKITDNYAAFRQNIKRLFVQLLTMSWQMKYEQEGDHILLDNDEDYEYFIEQYNRDQSQFQIFIGEKANRTQSINGSMMRNSQDFSFSQISQIDHAITNVINQNGEGNQEEEERRHTLDEDKKEGKQKKKDHDEEEYNQSQNNDNQSDGDGIDETVPEFNGNANYSSSDSSDDSSDENNHIKHKQEKINKNKPSEKKKKIEKQNSTNQQQKHQQKQPTKINHSIQTNIDRKDKDKGEVSKLCPSNTIEQEWKTGQVGKFGKSNHQSHQSGSDDQSHQSGQEEGFTKISQQKKQNHYQQPQGEEQLQDDQIGEAVHQQFINSQMMDPSKLDNSQINSHPPPSNLSNIPNQQPQRIINPQQPNQLNPSSQIQKEPSQFQPPNNQIQIQGRRQRLPPPAPSRNNHMPNKNIIQITQYQYNSLKSQNTRLTTSNRNLTQENQQFKYRQQQHRRQHQEHQRMQIDNSYLRSQNERLRGQNNRLRQIQIEYGRIRNHLFGISQTMTNTLNLQYINHHNTTNQTQVINPNRTNITDNHNQTLP